MDPFYLYFGFLVLYAWYGFGIAVTEYIDDDMDGALRLWAVKFPLGPNMGVFLVRMFFPIILILWWRNIRNA